MPASPEDPGLLGGLPRSRPGTRSQKRAGDQPRERTEPPPRPHSAPVPPPERPGTDDPIEAAARAAGRIAGAGLRVAGRLTGEALKRLPRP